MKLLITTLFHILVITSLSMADARPDVTVVSEQGWVESVGEAAADDARTVGEVKLEALLKARGQAIEKAAGIKIQGESLVRDFALQSDFVASLASGVIVEEKIQKWEADTVANNSINGPVVIYRVFLKSKVVQDINGPDSSFKISASLNRSVFKNGDDVILKIKTTSDCYLTIFVIAENNNVFMVLPNKYKKNNLLKVGDVFEYPSERDVVRGVTLKAGLLPGAGKAKEMFRIVATKSPINFTPDRFAAGIGLNSFDQETATVKELVQELITIPAKDRTETFLAYEIVK